MGILSVQRANTGTIPLKMRAPEIAQITAPTADQEWTVNDMRLIDADNLKATHRVRIDKHTGTWPCVLMVDISKAPAIDAVPVVRCKDCKYWHESTGFCLKNSYFIDSNEISCSPLESPNWTIWEENDFCSNGEMKDK